MVECLIKKNGGLNMRTCFRYCRKCREETVHYLVDKDSALRNGGVARGMLAVCSLGLSEVINSATIEKTWQCQKCGTIKK